MPKQPTEAERWIRERVQGEVERMLHDFLDRDLFISDDKDREEMAAEITALVLKKRWKRA